MPNHLNEKHKVLVVDDEIAVLDILKKIIDEAGFVTLTASDGDEAFKIIKSYHEELVFILSDLKMPKMGGLELRQKLLDDYKDIPFAIISGYITQEIAINAVKNKICGFIDKPFDEESILSLIKKESQSRIDEINFSYSIRETFLQESLDLIEEIEPLLLSLEDDPSNMNHVNAIYRVIHTIKGGSSTLRNENITKFLHQYEEIYSQLKKNEISATPDLISILLTGFDQVRYIIHAYAEQKEINFDFNDLLHSVSLEKTNFGPDKKPLIDEKIKKDNSTTQNAATPKSDHLSVPMALMDEFMAQSGEITVIRNMINKLVGSITKELPNNKNVQLLGELLDEIHKYNSSMQRKITDIRKVPMSQVIRAVPRTVRDVSRDIGKMVKVITSGENLRVDKVISQALSNSLVHMVRNSVDHGIETSEVRIKNGKDETGVIYVRCFEDSENITVEIEDDGAGLNVDFLRNKVIEKGLMTENESQNANEKKIFSMIFEPGFSTAEKITNISGRGVGMDMVRSSIQNLGGRIDIDSDLGKGTKFSLIMPIPKSVQIIETLIVDVSGQEYAIPQDKILRLLTIEKLKQHECVLEVEGAELLSLGGSLIPILKAEKILESQDDNIEPLDEMRNFVIVRNEVHDAYAIEVRQILDNESIVVKPIEKVVKNLKVFAGSTFLGDGAIGLILDPDGLLELAHIKAAEIEKNSEISADLKEIHQNENEFVTISLSTEGKFAYQLSDIFRLERIKKNKIQHSGSQKVLRYRNTLMPIVDTVQSLIFANDNGTTKEKSEDLEMVVIEYSGRYFGFEVLKILDIFYTNNDVELDLVSQKTMRGNIEINGENHVVLDPIEQLMFLKLIEKKEEEEEEEVITHHHNDQLGTDHHDKIKGFNFF